MKTTKRAMGTWLIGLVVSAGLSAALSGLIYAFPKDTIRPRDCKVLDGISYCAEAIAEHTLNYLTVLSWVLPIALLLWTVVYVGYRLIEY